MIGNWAETNLCQIVFLPHLISVKKTYHLRNIIITVVLEKHFAKTFFGFSILTINILFENLTENKFVSLNGPKVNVPCEQIENDAITGRILMFLVWERKKKVWKGVN